MNKFVGFKKEVLIRPAFDKRHKDPSKSYGIHGCDMTFVLVGMLGAIQFVIYTNWHLPHVKEELKQKSDPFLFLEPSPADVGYHSPVPQYAGQTTIQDECEWLDGKPCYYDGSGLAAIDYFDLLVREGLDAVWDKMLETYNYRFEESQEI